MTDKNEERILIIPCSGECICIRPVGNELYCGAHIHGDWQKIDHKKDCKDCKHAKYNGLTRAELVERMAKAMCQSEIGGCDKCAYRDIQYECLGCLDRNEMRAEAALDAI